MNNEGKQILNTVRYKVLVRRINSTPDSDRILTILSTRQDPVYVNKG